MARNQKKRKKRKKEEQITKKRATSDNEEAILDSETSSDKLKEGVVEATSVNEETNLGRETSWDKLKGGVVEETSKEFGKRKSSSNGKESEKRKKRKKEEKITKKRATSDNEEAILDSETSSDKLKEGVVEVTRDNEEAILDCETSREKLMEGVEDNEEAILDSQTSNDKLMEGVVEDISKEFEKKKFFQWQGIKKKKRKRRKKEEKITKKRVASRNYSSDDYTDEDVDCDDEVGDKDFVPYSSDETDSDLEELLDTFSTFVKNSDESDNSSISDTFPAIQMLTDVIRDNEETNGDNKTSREELKEGVVQGTERITVPLAKTGKKRIWDKKHACLYCCEHQSNLRRHLFRKHANELEVAKKTLLIVRKTALQHQKRVHLIHLEQLTPRRRLTCLSPLTLHQIQTMQRTTTLHFIPQTMALQHSRPTPPPSHPVPTQASPPRHPVPTQARSTTPTCVQKSFTV
ncbi:uncharacterized protein LOC125683423 isoform X3 [Ostrea edulis]|uniref:uncharacterized protein LOC125683423 isoform X3 n=1 Tax=Ostrea edulis TaxID=37623 RepID=UPI0024AF35B1|nr:uncharacterized protein LOC125683423 isoform X3 [Ostrea edulis]